jgi:hypothetical protein
MTHAVSTPTSRKKNSTFLSIGFTRIGPSRAARIVNDATSTVIISQQLMQQCCARASHDQNELALKLNRRLRFYPAETLGAAEAIGSILKGISKVTDCGILHILSLHS